MPGGCGAGGACDVWQEGLSFEGFIAFEIGYNQAEAVKKIFVENGYPNVTIAKDLAGFDRVVIGMIIW